MHTMGDQIRRLRIERNWTQDELARMIGAGDKYISALESGRRKPGPKLMTQLCNAFGVTEQVIRFGGEEKKHAPPILQLLVDRLSLLTETEQLEWLVKVRRWQEEDERV